TAAPFDRGVTDIPVAGKGDWTRVSLGKRHHRRLVMLLAGNWTLSQPVIEEVSVRMAAALTQVENRAAGGSGRSTVGHSAWSPAPGTCWASSASPTGATAESSIGAT